MFVLRHLGIDVEVYFAAEVLSAATTVSRTRLGPPLRHVCSVGEISRKRSSSFIVGLLLLLLLWLLLCGCLVFAGLCQCSDTATWSRLEESQVHRASPCVLTIRRPTENGNVYEWKKNRGKPVGQHESQVPKRCAHSAGTAVIQTRDDVFKAKIYWIHRSKILVIDQVKSIVEHELIAS